MGRRTEKAGGNGSQAEAGAARGAASPIPTSRRGSAAGPLEAAVALSTSERADDDLMELARAIYDLFAEARRNRREQETAAATAAAV